jgi:hypothetical protein
MNNNVRSRLISAVIVIIFAGFLGHAGALHRSQLGKEAFLAKQAERFDKFYVTPHSVGFYIFGSAIVFGGGLVVYELIALGILTILSKCSKEEASAGLPPPI